MTYSDLWRPLARLYDDGEAKAIVRLLLSERFGLTLNDVVSGAVEQLPPAEAGELCRLHGRLMAGEPVQYVLGEADFCGRRFVVRPGVLIPRPETEELCRLITSHLSPLTPHPSPLTSRPSPLTPHLSPLKVLDIGTGSGCIAVTLALDLPGAQVTAWDISDDALRIAADNARRLGVSVTFEKVDVLSAPLPRREGLFNLIVSNPPYICRKEQAQMHRNVVEHEPEEALFVPDDDPLLFYRAIGRYALKALEPGGSLFFELNPQYARATADMLTEMGYRDVTIRQDQFGKDRFIQSCK